MGWRRARDVRGLSAADDLASLEAGRAYVLALGGAADQRAHALDIGIPAALGASVGVRDGIAEAGALAADIAVGSHSALSKTRIDRRLEPRRERLPERHG